MVANTLVAFVALLHILFLILEMFLWTKPLGRRTFGLNRELAVQTATLAANQGLYNGFLAAGLIWGLMSGTTGRDILVFFLVCIVIAGIFGALTAKRTILWIQALPGVAALTAVLLAQP